MRVFKTSSLTSALKRSLFAGTAVFVLYRLMIACSLLIDSRDTFATPLYWLTAHWCVELGWALFLAAAAAYLGWRYAVVYMTFLGLELSIVFLSQMPVGVYEFLCIGGFPAVYALTAFLLPSGPLHGARCVYWLLVPLVLLFTLQYGIYIAYILRFGGRPSPMAVMAALGTNIEEARSFLSDQFGVTFIALAASVTVGALALAVGLSRSDTQKKRLPILLLIIAAASITFGLRSKADCYSTLFFDLRHGVRNYRLTRKTLSHLHRDRSAQAAALNAVKHGTGEICLVVIGESANRLHHACNGYSRPTTPWLSSNGALILKNAFACMVHTDPALTMALSRLNTYDPRALTGKEELLSSVMESLSLPEILRAADVKTFWFSSQNRVGVYDNFVTAQLAMNTNKQIFTRDENVQSAFGSVRLDGDLLPHLRKAIESLAPADNAVIFLHLIGSHWRYGNDTPSDWPYLPHSTWVDELHAELREKVELYDRSISYTDWMLSQFAAEIERSKFAVGSMFYFSDHSEDVLGEKGHNYDALSAPMTMIPAAFWCTKGYEQRWPETVATLRANSGRVFTNDLAFELICGINHVTFDGLDERFQLTSPAYSVTPENARFWQGRMLKDIVPGLSEE